MTFLESKELRDSYGIDTFERGYIYAILLLRASNTDIRNKDIREKNPYEKAVRLTFNFTSKDKQGNVSPQVITQATIPYSSYPALKTGGLVFDKLGQFNNTDPNPFEYIAAPTIDVIGRYPLPISNDPIWVTTLERYLVWCALNIYLGLSKINESGGNKYNSVFNLQIQEEVNLGQESYVSINGTLNFDRDVFFARNLISAIIPQISSGLPNQNTSPPIDDDLDEEEMAGSDVTLATGIV